ncbi:MAG: type II secretion system protein GspL [Aquincola tertiaricarbonis]|uniref:type II secretion system protein GspL n=1 Tax=Aquincola tertiaricarbonis TaxID=391953 RepID=UPI000614B526|nr:type II secretion system protein GspL [Aquincola tertiaricarbonis]
MSILVVKIPPRDRLQPGRAEPVERTASEYAYVLSSDGLAVSGAGRCAPALLPKADTVVAVLADTDVSWQRITLPRAPAARLRAALVGVLEEALLEDAEALHLAVAPGAAAGQPTWIAAMPRAWLALHLATLETAGLSVERVLPAAWPDEAALGHLAEPLQGDADAAPVLTWADADGVLTLGLNGGLARQMLPQWQATAARWSATPGAAGAAEQWLGAPVQVLSDDERALQAVRSRWNLRQFDLAPRHRGMQAVREAWRRFMSPAFRPVRWGLASLVVVQIVGLNLWAWHERGEIESRRLAMLQVLRTAHPQVRAVLDAPLQMARETEQLRVAAGKPGETDLEGLLNVAASAWPVGAAPAASLRFEPGRLSFTALDWGPQQIEEFRGQLRPAGWQVEESAGTLTVSRAPTGRTS